MAESTIWWLLAGTAVAVELVTGTFYLLMVAFGLAAGAIAAHLGAGPVLQLLAAALVGGGAVVAWHLVRSRQPRPVAASADPNVNLDIGVTVNVDAWNADGTASIRYRGASWSAIAAPGEPQAAGAYRVREVVGSRLVLEKA